MIERKKCFCGGTSTRYDRDVRGNWWFGFRCMTCKWETGVLSTMDDGCRAWNSDMEHQGIVQTNAMLTYVYDKPSTYVYDKPSTYQNPLEEVERRDVTLLRRCICGMRPMMKQKGRYYSVQCDNQDDEIHCGCVVRGLWEPDISRAIESWRFWLKNFDSWMCRTFPKTVNVLDAMEERYGMPKPRKCWCGREPMIAQGGDSSLWKAYCQNDCHNPGGYMTDGFDTINGVIASWNQKVERDIAKFIKVNA